MEVLDMPVEVPNLNLTNLSQWREYSDKLQVEINEAYKKLEKQRAIDTICYLFEEFVIPYDGEKVFNKEKVVIYKSDGHNYGYYDNGVYIRDQSDTIYNYDTNEGEIVCEIDVRVNGKTILLYR